MYYSKVFNSNYMQFVGYETCDNLIWKLGEGYINKTTIRKQEIPKSNMNNTSPPSTLGFGCYLHEDTCDVLSEDLVSHRLQAYSSKMSGLY